MTQYSFTISNADTFEHSQDLPSDEMAWREALLTVRDIEASLSPDNGHWSLEVKREEQSIFRIEVSVVKTAS